jgi:hypothetical protein
MLGAVAGEMLAGLLFQVVAGAYYALTGQEPVKYRVFPV